MNTTKLFGIFAIAGSMFFTSCEKDESNETTGTSATSFKSQELLDGDGNVVETITTITDFGNGVGTKTLSSNTTWVLDGIVFVNSGQTLTIEPGTVIKGKSGQGENASALVVAKGAKIMAEGTAANPIIMTAEADQIRRMADGSGFENGGNLNVTSKGLWGGLIVLGDAVLNSAPGESSIEGISTNEKRGLYGGSNDEDNSGVITYVSIRHGGTDIGSGNEINGLTLGGVGSGTTINHVEVIANNDDGIECFGGTARISNAVITLVGDDAFDYDEGYRGLVEFMLVYQPGDRGGEHDGGTKPEDGNPYAKPTIVNVTSIGKGATAGKRAITFRDNAGGYYWNSLFTQWGKGVDVEDLASGEDSKTRLDAGDLKIMYNTFDGVATDMMSDIVVDSDGGALDMHASVVGNDVMSLVFSGVIPTATVPSAMWTGFDDKGFFSKASFKGAFNPDGSDMWHAGWTLTDEAAIIQ